MPPNDGWVVTTTKAMASTTLAVRLKTTVRPGRLYVAGEQGGEAEPNARPVTVCEL